MPTRALETVTHGGDASSWHLKGYASWWHLRGYDLEATLVRGYALEAMHLEAMQLEALLVRDT
jgi:hypothetical protein